MINMEAVSFIDSLAPAPPSILYTNVLSVTCSSSSSSSSSPSSSTSSKFKIADENMMMIPMMMLNNNNNFSSSLNQVETENQTASIHTTNTTMNSHSNLATMSFVDDAAYVNNTNLNPNTILMTNNLHSSTTSSVSNTSNGSIMIIQQQQTDSYQNNQIFSNSESTIGQITHHPTIFRYQAPYSPSTVISTIGTPPPIQQVQQQQQQQQTSTPTVVPPPSLIKASKSNTVPSEKVIAIHKRKISRNDSSSSTNSIKTPNQHCKVCGDTSIGKNFGVVTCGSCKIFFSRNIDSKERLQCRNHNRCMETINKSNRRNCSACRLDKCIRLGMRVKRNRQKQHSFPSNAMESKIMRNQNRTSSESSSNHMANADGNYFIHNQDQSSTDIEISPDGPLSDMDYERELPSLVPIDQVAPSNLHFDCSNRAEQLMMTTVHRQPQQQTENQYENDFIMSENANHNLNFSVDEEQHQQSDSIIQQQPPQQQLFNSVSVIQQAPSKPPSSVQTVSATDDNNIVDSEAEEEEEENGVTTTSETEGENETNENVAMINNNNISNKDYGNEILLEPSSSSVSPGVVCEMSRHDQMIVPYGSTSNSLINLDYEDDSSIEQQTRDVFNYSHVQTCINAHTRYNYNNFYEEHYYKYYYLPDNNHLDYQHSYCDCDTATNGNENSSGSSTVNSHQNSLASVELCKVEAKNFGDQDHALIAELEKWKPYIRIKLGLDYTTASSTMNHSHNFDYHHHIHHHQHHHHLFAKEQEMIENLNLSCRMISAKPQSHDQLRAIFDSLERGIFYANKSFKLYEDFWSESEISELIRQNETGFIKKKNNLLHMLYHLRGVQNFDENLNAWAIFNGVNDNGFTMIKLDMFQQSIKKEMATTHRQYITSFPREWRMDPTVFNLMTYLLLFGAFDRPHSPFKCEKLIYFQYLYLFKRYFECMYNSEEKAQQMLLWMLKLIRQLSPLCFECLTACTHSLNPAVLKKIGPNYAQCLMMEEKQQSTSNNKNGLCQISHHMTVMDWQKNQQPTIMKEMEDKVNLQNIVPNETPLTENNARQQEQKKSEDDAAIQTEE